MTTTNEIQLSEEELIVPAMFPRSTILSTRKSTDRLKLACKLYRTSSGSAAQDGTQQASIFFVNGNGFPKECYEPMFKALVGELLDKHKVQIKYILAMEPVNQGRSAVINEDALGNDIMWTDCWRDVVVTHYYMGVIGHEIVQMPLIGVGHSFGGNTILGASTINTQMFEVVVGIDAVVGKPSVVEMGSPFIPSLKRRDRWPARDEAWESLKRNKFYATWCDESFDNYIKYGLRDLPTATYPAEGRGVTLTCPVTQELATFQNLPEEEDAALKRMCPRDCLDALQRSARVPTRLLVADVGRMSWDVYQRDLGRGAHGVVSFQDLGAAATHSVPFEAPGQVAREVAAFVGAELPGRLARAAAGDLVERYGGVHPVHLRHHAKALSRRGRATLRESKV